MTEETALALMKISLNLTELTLQYSKVSREKIDPNDQREGQKPDAIDTFKAVHHCVTSSFNTLVSPA